MNNGFLGYNNNCCHIATMFGVLKALKFDYFNFKKRIKIKMMFKELSKKYDLKEKPIKGCYGTFICSVFAALIVRFCCIVHGCVLITYVIVKWDTQYLYPCYLILISLLIEAAYVVFLRQGRESKYFSICIFLYLLACVPPMWVLHYKRQPYVLYKLYHSQNIDISDKQGLTLVDVPKFTQTDDFFFRKNENLFLTIIVLSRWFLPKDDLTREDNYAIIIQILSMAADVHEMFYSTDTLKILKYGEDTKPHLFTFFIVSIWSLSLPLFAINTSTETYAGKKFRQVSKRYLEKLFGNFYWKYITSMLVMDGPYFSIRMVGIISYQIIDYQNVFYIAKNLIQITIQIYSILGKIFFPEISDLVEQNMRKVHEIPFELKQSAKSRRY